MNLQNAWQRLADVEDEPDPERRIELLRPLLEWARDTPGLPAVWQIELRRWLANAHQNIGNLREAFDLRVEAAKLAADPANDCPAGIQLWVEGDLGRSYVEARHWQRAEEQFRKALALAEECGEEREAIICKLNLSLACSNTGKLRECRDLAEEVLGWGVEHDDSYVLALQHFNTASRLYREVRLNECHRQVQEALAHAIKSGNVPLQAAARRLQGETLHLGHLLTGQQKYSNESERHLLQSREAAAAIGNPVLEAQAALALADFYESRHRTQAAFRAYQSALSVLEKVRDQLGFEEFQLSFFRALEPIYGKAVEFLLRQKRTEDAFRTAELLRSRLLLEALGPQRSDLAVWFPDQKLRLERVLDDFFRATLDERRADTNAVRCEFLRLQEEQSLKEARWHDRCSPPVVSFDTAQRRLGDQGALLAYFVTDQSLAIFVATNQLRHFQHLPYPHPRLASDVDQIRREIEVIRSHFRSPGFQAAWRNRDVRCAGVALVQKSEERLYTLLERLYAILIAPVLAAVADRRHWIIVPHGPLHQLPWAALRSGGRYLVERHTLSVLPSASIGAALEEQSPSMGEAVFFADPDPDHHFLALPGARREAQAGCDTLNAGPSPFLGAAATKDEVLARAETAGLIHFACHHLFDQNVPQLSFLKLAGSRGSDQLFAFEVSELRLSTRLVTLAACGSGKSQTAVGDEQMGMVRSFLSAGARSVVSALWPIADDSTAHLFSLFYRAARNMGLAEALVYSQRELLRDPRYDLPYFWAPFVLSGEWKEPLRLQKGESR